MAYTKMEALLEEQFQESKGTGLFKEERIITTGQGADIDTSRGPSINFCANNYLGRSTIPR
jgi:glycine C-acetyltransferase